MAGRAVRSPPPVAAITLPSSNNPAADRAFQQAQQAIQDLQDQVRALAARVAVLEAGEAGE
jgi:hypothetical protein